jgi:hypothetical protein
LGAVAKHRAGDVEQPIADRAEGTCVAVTAEAQSRVLSAAARIVLRGDACPVVEGIPEPRITGEPSCDDPALAGPLGDRSCATGDVDRTRIGPSDTRERRGHFRQARASMGKIPQRGLRLGEAYWQEAGASDRAIASLRSRSSWSADLVCLPSPTGESHQTPLGWCHPPLSPIA